MFKVYHSKKDIWIRFICILLLFKNIHIVCIEKKESWDNGIVPNNYQLSYIIIIQDLFYGVVGGDFAELSVESIPNKNLCRHHRTGLVVYSSYISIVLQDLFE